MIESDQKSYVTCQYQPTIVARECYVDSLDAARYLKVTGRNIRRWAKLGLIPAHVLRHGDRHSWRFKLSELDEWMRADSASTRSALCNLAPFPTVQ